MIKEQVSRLMVIKNRVFSECRVNVKGTDMVGIQIDGNKVILLKNQ